MLICAIIELAVLWFGGNKPIVIFCGFLLIHGLGGTPIEMRYVAQGLARAGHTAHVPQLAGHCGTAADLKAQRLSNDPGYLQQTETHFYAGLRKAGIPEK